jgi:hypothetical protein
VPPELPSRPVKCRGRLVVVVTDVDMVDHESFRPGGTFKTGGLVASGTTPSLPSLQSADGNGSETATLPRVQVVLHHLGPLYKYLGPSLPAN